jgi:HEAT repeat protein
VLVRRRVANALGQIALSAKAAVPGLIAALKDLDVAKDRSEMSVSQIAAHALRFAKPAATEAVPALIEAADRQDPLLRDLAIDALGRIGLRHESVLPALLRILRTHGDTGTRAAAAGALGFIGPAAKVAVPDLLELLKFTDPKDSNTTYTIRGAVVVTLGEIGPDAKAAVPALIEAFRDKNPAADPVRRLFFRRDVARALGKIGPSAATAIPALIDVLKDTRENSLGDDSASALAAIGPRAIPALVDLLQHSSTSARRCAIHALNLMGPAAKPAEPAMKDALHDKDPAVAREAAEALEKLRPG